VTSLLDGQGVGSESPPLSVVQSMPEEIIRRGQWRRWRANLVRSSIFQGAAAMSVAVTLTVTSLLLQRDGSYGLGIGSLGGACVGLGVFVMLGLRAMEREKIIEYWHDRRKLRLELRRQEAHKDLLARTLSRVHDLEAGDGGQVQGVLARSVDDVYQVLKATHDDVAVILAHERDGRYFVLHSTTSAGSRWRSLRHGKSCRAERDTFEETLADLAPYFLTCAISTDTSLLRIGVLSDGDFSEDDQILFRQVSLCFSLIAARWGKPYRSRPGSLRSVS
jgi:hypothetical protein